MERLSGRPLLDNPVDSALFIDRRAELDLLRGSAGAGFNGVVFGDRGAGKTTLLHRLAYELRQEGANVAFVDGHLPDDATELLELIRYEIGGPRRRMRPVIPSEFSRAEMSVTESEELLRAVRTLGNALSKRGTTTVLLDGAPSSRDAHTLFGRLRDELWRLPLGWIVAADSDDRHHYLMPPADAFFEHVVDLAPLGVEDSLDLLRKRVENSELSDSELRRLVVLAKGNPRELVTLARLAIREMRSPDSLGRERAEVWRQITALGRPAAMLAAELEALGAASASDERLLRRLGWTRARAVQVLKELEREGLVESSTLPAGGSGRPQKIYSLIRR